MTGFHFRFPIDGRFRDLDLLGHVNNAVLLTYLESARLAYWTHLTGRPLDDLGMILARVEIDYRAPVRHGTRVDVGVRCASMRRSSFVLEFEAVEKLDQLHPDLHCLVPGGGLANGRWVDRRRYLLPTGKLASCSAG